MMEIPDYSFWDDDPSTPNGVNFDVAYLMGVRAVIIRAGQNLWIDNEFTISWVNAKKTGLLRGSYWFYDSRANPKRQAEKYIEALGGDRGEMEMWCDFEDNYGGEYGGWRNWFDFMERLKQLAPEKQLGVYTRASYFDRFAYNETYFAKYPLWVAHYKTNKPTLPHVFKNWTLWQYTDSGDGRAYGSESKEVDLSYFNGTDEEFFARYEVTHDPLLGSLTATFNGGTIAEYRRIK